MQSIFLLKRSSVLFFLPNDQLICFYVNMSMWFGINCWFFFLSLSFFGSTHIKWGNHWERGGLSQCPLNVESATDRIQLIWGSISTCVSILSENFGWELTVVLYSYYSSTILPWIITRNKQTNKETKKLWLFQLDDLILVFLANEKALH